MHFRSLLLLALLPVAASAELRLPAIIGSNMVLQQQQSNPLWGWDTPGTEVKVSFGSQTKTGTADEKGRWTVKLDPVPASNKPATLTIQGTSKKELTNVLVGEVWLCSGQSNMGFTVERCFDGDLEIASAKHPQIRLISVPQVGTQELQDDFKGQWEECSPANVGQFTAVGFFFGRVLHQALDVPVGLIDNAWGGSSCEAWVHRPVLEKDARFKALMEQWKKTESSFSDEAFQKQVEAHKAKVDAWAMARREAIKNKQPIPANPPRAPQNPMTGQHRPGNLYAGVLNPIIGYGIKGAVWYQGESNASRAMEYRTLFPLMITHWRERWKQGDFPFYWVQLADYKAEVAEPGDSDWAELREAQTLSMTAIKNGGQAVITDLGEGRDIHPRNKRDVAERLARWALAKNYGVNVQYRSPELKNAAFEKGRAVVMLDTFGSTLTTFDVAEARGFALCGKDQVWHWATGKVTGPDKVEVSSPQVAEPVAVRYAWSDNPVCNLFAANGLPVTPFRSDDFPLITDPKNPNNPANVQAQRVEALKKLAAARQANQAKGKTPAAKKEEVKKAVKP